MVLFVSVSMYNNVFVTGISVVLCVFGISSSVIFGDLPVNNMFYFTCVCVMCKIIVKSVAEV